MKITHKKLELIGASWLTETGCPGELAILYGMINKAEQRSVTIYGYAL